MSNEPKKIPVKVAKQVHDSTGYPIIIVIGINNDRGGSIATYGKNKHYCKLAGHIGQEEIRKALFDESGILSKDFDFLFGNRIEVTKSDD